MQLRIAALVCIASLATLITSSQPVMADDNGFPTSIITQNNTPLRLTRCSVAKSFVNLQTSVSAVNRADVFLMSYVVRSFFYDHSSALITQGDAQFTMTSDVAPGDVTNNQDSPRLSSGVTYSAIGHVTCRLQSARFEGGKTWEYGRQWKGKLVPAPVQQSSVGNSNGVPALSAVASSQTPSVTVAVTNAWNDVFNGATFIHDSLIIRGGDTNTTISPGQFILTMALANGAQKTYYGLAQAAPTYQKLNPLGSTTMTAYEVDPRNDLGGLGSIIVPAHGSVAITVTFVVADVIADPAANRTVALK